jgi:excisionase family DNA binding protein
MEDILYSVKETSQLLKTNTDYVYKLIRLGMLPALKLGSYKVRKVSLLLFLETYEGKDLTDPEEVKELETTQTERSTY